eukprot:Clim_evm24s119 gene=Clim_evmTU24s119
MIGVLSKIVVWGCPNLNETVNRLLDVMRSECYSNTVSPYHEEVEILLEALIMFVSEVARRERPADIEPDDASKNLSPTQANGRYRFLKFAR